MVWIIHMNMKFSFGNFFIVTRTYYQNNGRNKESSIINYATKETKVNADMYAANDECRRIKSVRMTFFCVTYNRDPIYFILSN